MMGASALADALALAEYGLAVFPCLPSKAPACPQGFKRASRDPAAVRELWRRWPSSLIGIATGIPSGLAVLDIDAGKGGGAWWAAHRAALPETRTIRTRSGGLHLWFRHLPGLRCSAGTIAPGVDVRAEGGYVIAWHRAGLPVLRDAAPAAWPAGLISPAAKPSIRRTDPPRVPDDAQLAALLRFLAAAGEGERNKRLFWAGCRMAGMVASRFMTRGEAESLLLPAGRMLGLSELETGRTVRSALAGGRA